MKPFSFVHVADLHLGYTQYNMEIRREDFDKAFKEVVEKTVQLKPDFIIIAGDLFQHARPSNVTLENAIKNFKQLKDAGIQVLAVDGSHDAAPNIITSTILNPLDSAGLIYYLPRHEGACWRNQNCYVYGIPCYRTKQKTEEQLPQFYAQHKPTPKPDAYNIFVFHGTLDMANLKPPQMEAEISAELLPEGFNYYAGGHVHKPSYTTFKKGLLVYSGSVETVNYEDASAEKGFYHVKVNENGVAKLDFVRLESPRRFIILKRDFSGMTPNKITEAAIQLIKEKDEMGAIIVPILEGVLPTGANRSEVDTIQIRSAAEKALLVHPIIRLREAEVPEEIIRSIFEGELKDLKTKAYEYFLQIFSEIHGREEAERIAKLALNILEPLTRKEEDKVKESLEAYVNANRNSRT